VESLKKKIEAIILDQKVSKNPPLAALLSIISGVYGQITRLRKFSYRKSIAKSHSLPCMVISIGNITLGGTGKTPMTIYLAELMKRMGRKVAILSRGYKGEAEKKGGLVSDGRKVFMTPDQAGDEPFMMAGLLKDVPVFVGSNRFENGRIAMEKFQPDVILLDDGFQHLQLKRDIDLVLLDHANPFGNGRLLPRGPLREPLSALSRGDAFIMTRSDCPEGRLSDLLKNQIGQKPVFKTRHLSYICHVSDGKGNCPIEPDFIKGKKGFAFSGIAKNSDFRDSLKGFAFALTGFSEFPDHHNYKEEELASIGRKAIAQKADFLVTTQKDFSRIGHAKDWSLPLVVIGIKISFDNQTSKFERFIAKRVEKGGTKE
jgi:tetraacyldisaccharide 4'-kinase